MAPTPRGMARAVRSRLRRETLPDQEVTSANNFEYNRRLWSGYAVAWEDPSFRAQMIEGDVRSRQLDVLGDEWGTPDDVRAVIDDFILPFLAADSVVGEIGTGGGRIAREVAGLVGTFYAFDISPEMLDRLSETLSGQQNVVKVLLSTPGIPVDLTGTFDFLYAFDVFVHFDLHMQWRYLQDIARSLKPGANAMVHTSNLVAPAGWARFASQEAYSVEGHYFVVPELVRTLAGRAGLEVVKESTIDSANYYYGRDYLCIVRKPTA